MTVPTAGSCSTQGIRSLETCQSRVCSAIVSDKLPRTTARVGTFAVRGPAQAEDPQHEATQALARACAGWLRVGKKPLNPEMSL